MNGSLTAEPLKLGGLYGCTGLEPALGRTDRTEGRHRFLISSEHLNKRPKAINNLRFHHVKKVNESLFLKLGWWLPNNTRALWVRILKAARSAYRKLTEFVAPTTSAVYKKLWARTTTQPRVLHFLCRWLNEALTTNARRARVMPGVWGCPSLQSCCWVRLHCPVVVGVWNNPRIEFDIVAGDDVNSAIERWLNLSGDRSNVFAIGSNLMRCLWKCHCKWGFERNPFSFERNPFLV